MVHTVNQRISTSIFCGPNRTSSIQARTQTNVPLYSSYVCIHAESAGVFNTVEPYKLRDMNHLIRKFSITNTHIYNGEYMCIIGCISTLLDYLIHYHAHI